MNDSAIGPHTGVNLSTDDHSLSSATSSTPHSHRKDIANNSASVSPNDMRASQLPSDASTHSTSSTVYLSACSTPQSDSVYSSTSTNYFSCPSFDSLRLPSTERQNNIDESKSTKKGQVFTSFSVGGAIRLPRGDFIANTINSAATTIGSAATALSAVVASIYPIGLLFSAIATEKVTSERSKANEQVRDIYQNDLSPAAEVALNESERHNKVQRKEVSGYGMATAGSVLGIAGMVLSNIPVVGVISGIITGIGLAGVGFQQIRNDHIRLQELRSRMTATKEAFVGDDQKNFKQGLDKFQAKYETILKVSRLNSLLFTGASIAFAFSSIVTLGFFNPIISAAIGTTLFARLNAAEVLQDKFEVANIAPDWAHMMDERMVGDTRESNFCHLEALETEISEQTSRLQFGNNPLQGAKFRAYKFLGLFTLFSSLPKNSRADMGAHTMRRRAEAAQRLGGINEVDVKRLKLHQKVKVRYASMVSNAPLPNVVKNFIANNPEHVRNACEQYNMRRTPQNLLQEMVQSELKIMLQSVKSMVGVMSTEKEQRINDQNESDIDFHDPRVDVIDDHILKNEDMMEALTTFFETFITPTSRETSNDEASNDEHSILSLSHGSEDSIDSLIASTTVQSLESRVDQLLSQVDNLNLLQADKEVIPQLMDQMKTLQLTFLDAVGNEHYDDEGKTDVVIHRDFLKAVNQLEKEAWALKAQLFTVASTEALQQQQHHY